MKSLKRFWLAAVAFLVLTGSQASAQDDPRDRPVASGWYTQIYGGVGTTGSTTATQQGVAFFPDAAGGPLSVYALGNSGRTTLGMGGITLGYEFPQRCDSILKSWGLRTAAEFEVFYSGYTRTANLPAPGPRLPEHNFVDKLPTNSATFLANAVISINTPWERVRPYVGFGVGTTYVNIHNADSLQTAPPEAGINHFNSIPHATDWAFTTQLKAGVRFELTERIWLFSEYRLLSLHATSFAFGSTQYAVHPPTTGWNLGLGMQNQSIGVAGIGFKY